VQHRHEPVSAEEREKILAKLIEEKTELETSQKEIAETLSQFVKPELSVTNPKIPSDTILRLI